MSSKQISSADSKSHSESDASQSESEESSSLEILTRIRQKLIEMGDPPFSLHPQFIDDDKEGNNFNKNENIKSQNKIKCIYCLNDIQNNEILCTTPCCNGICHVKCIKEINGKEEILQACPKCLTKLSPKFKEIIDTICTVI